MCCYAIARKVQKAPLIRGRTAVYYVDISILSRSRVRRFAGALCLYIPCLVPVEMLVLSRSRVCLVVIGYKSCTLPSMTDSIISATRFTTCRTCFAPAILAVVFTIRSAVLNDTAAHSRQWKHLKFDPRNRHQLTVTAAKVENESLIYATGDRKHQFHCILQVANQHHPQTPPSTPP